ncbi:MORN repeat-containing protein [Lachnospiraceae bacterium]|nr:MORN repeat-containing protein [Lachnospiraceae bacterium]
MNKKDKKEQFHIPWKKIAATVVLLFFITFGIMVLRFRLTYHPPTEVYHENIKHELVWDGTTFKGVYDGDFQNTQPNGKGTFTGERNTLIYDGEWEKGLFSGEGRITYTDGTIEEGQFLEGKRNGRVRKYASASEAEKGQAGSFVETIYDMDIPYARSDIYENGKKVSTEYYINATPMSEIMDEAKPLTEKLIKKEGYYNTYIYVDGVVEFFGDTAESSYFRINTDSVGMVYGTYDNTYGLTSEQAYIPNLKQGEKVRVYGYYMGLTKYNVYTDNDGYGNKLSKIMPFLIVRSEDVESASSGNMAADAVSDGHVVSYDILCDNPYFSNMAEINDTFIINNISKTGLTFTITAYPESSPEELYTLIYEGDVMDRFLTGSSIKVKGYVAGQTKRLIDEERDEIMEDGVKSDDMVTYSFEKQPVIMVEELR